MSGMPDPPNHVFTINMDHLRGQTIKIVDVELRSRKWPIVVLDNGERYECDNEWASRGATYLYGELQASGRDEIEVRVVEEQGLVGFRE